LVIIFAAGIAALTTNLLGLWSAGFDDEISFNVYNYESNEAIPDADFDLTILGVDVSDMTESEISDLTIDDFEVIKELDNGDSFTFLDNYRYIYNISSDDYCDTWGVPIEGRNDIYLIEEADDIVILAYSDDSLDTTISGTIEKDWTVMVQAQDDEGKFDETLGFMPYDDFSEGKIFDRDDDEYDTICLIIEFNTTALTSYCELDPIVTHQAVVDGDYLVFEIRSGFLGSAEYNLEFSEEIGLGDGADAEVVRLWYGHGNLDGTISNFVEWDNSL
jgi:hypothetical protein